METFTFIITEKPNAARQIAIALDKANEPKLMRENGVPYYEAQRNGKLLIVPAIGHLYTIIAKKRNGENPILDYEWVPRHLAEKRSSKTRSWLQTIAKLAQGADAFIDACDFDIEGSIIGFCILKYACEGKENVAKRMKYSTLTQEELEKSYANLSPHLDLGLIEAGLARHEIDWLYGINLSRALTSAAKRSGKYAILSTGRVQGPTIRFLAKREINISRFESTPFWKVKAKIEVGNVSFDAEYYKAVIKTGGEAEALAKKCKGITGIIEKVETNRSRQSPPTPFDLGTLQSEAYRLFGYTPSRTSKIAQKLYLDALISYPRTSSQKIPAIIGYEKILRGLSRNPEYEGFALDLLAKAKLKPVEGKQVDSAHPAICPTGKIAEKRLLEELKNVYDLIARRFMAVFSKAAVVQKTKVTSNFSGEEFILNGREIVEKGWHRFFEPNTRVGESRLPSLTVGEKCCVKKIKAEKLFTKPPARYNAASLLKEMERERIGTKATRAGILQTLYTRKYIQGKEIAVSKLGSEIANVLWENCPGIVSVKFTRKLEKQMESIQQGKETKEKVLNEAIEALKPVLANLKANEQTVGDRLSEAIQEVELQKKAIGPCPSCHNGKLLIQVSKRTGKRFVGCTNYFNGTCRTAFPLPQKGNAKPSHRSCSGCGWSTVTVWLNRKLPWTLCFNPDCPSRKKKSKVPTS